MTATGPKTRADFGVLIALGSAPRQALLESSDLEITRSVKRRSGDFLAAANGPRSPTE